MRQLDGIRRRDLQRLAEAAALRRGGGRDLALISLAHDAMLRPREIPNVRWNHLNFLPDGSAALAVSMLDGTWGSRPVSRETTQLLAHLLEDGVPPEAPVFPLRTSQINRRVSALCRMAGMTGQFGASSPRIGRASDLADDGMTVEALSDFGRWKGLESAWGFVQRSRSYERLHTLHGEGA